MMEFDMQKVWMVWQTVDFNQDWMMGVFSTEAKAESAMADMFAEWADDRGTTVDQWRASQAAQPWSDMDEPFFVTATNVQ
jgi:hypothetical protein